ncbi:MAG: hypothetical protein ACO34J_08490, partial [Prochlorothrix sp.]
MTLVSFISPKSLYSIDRPEQPIFLSFINFSNQSFHDRQNSPKSEASTMQKSLSLSYRLPPILSLPQTLPPSTPHPKPDTLVSIQGVTEECGFQALK